MLVLAMASPLPSGAGCPYSWFDEAVVGERVLAAGGEEVGKGAKESRLILQQVDYLHVELASS